MKTEEPKMITAKEYAEIHNVHYTTVMNWLRRDLVPGAIKEELPFGGYFYKIPANTPIPELKPGPKTFGERLKAIAEEIVEELSEQYADVVLHQQAPDSNDWDLTYTAHSGEEKTVRVIRRANQTDDEVNDEILARLLSKTDGPRRASKKASKKVKKGAK
jgi:hypothetical protein